MSSPAPSWDERLDTLHRRFPSTADPYWTEALQDYSIMGRLIRDTLRVGHTPKRRGSRPMLEIDEGMARLAQLFGDDYTTVPFNQALVHLAAGRSLTQVARRTGLSRSKVDRLMRGAAPSGREMAMVAAGFHKPSTYFMEYRVGLVCAAVAERLMAAPDASVGLVRALKGQ